MNDLEPELQSQLRAYDESLNDMRAFVETQKCINKGLKLEHKDYIDIELKKLRDEYKGSISELLSYTQEFQSEHETEAK